MDEQKPLISHHVTDKNRCKLQQHEEWDSYQLAFIMISVTLYASAALLSVPFTTQYVYSRVAEAHSFNTSQINTVDSPCNSSAKNSTELDDIQSESTQWMLFITLCNSIPCFFVNAIFGAHADSRGRKPFFIIPTLGGLVKAVGVAATVLWDLPLYVIVISSFIEGLSGSFMTFLVASFSSIADMTNKGKSRSFYIAAIEGTAGAVSGLVLIGSGYFIRNTGFLYPAVTIASIYALGLLVEACLLKETLKNNVVVAAIRQKLQGTVWLFTRSEHRLIYAICLITFFLEGLTNLAKGNVVTLFILNEPFCFSAVDVGWLSFLTMFVPSFGGLLLLKLLQFCLSDKYIVLLSILSNGGCMLLQGLARYSYQIFLVPVVGVIGQLVYPLTRGIVSRMTDSEHQGGLFGAFATFEVLSYLTSSLLLNLIYENTVYFFPGTVFLLLAGVSAVMFLLFMTVVCRETPTTRTVDDIREVCVNT